MYRPRTLALVALAALSALWLSALALGQQNQRIYLPALRGPASPTTQPTTQPTTSPTTSPTTQPGPGNPVHTGRATYYNANGDGNCMFGPSPGDLMVAAISYLDYGNPDPNAGPAAVYCGAYVEVTGELGTVVVRIVDKCPDAGCERGHLDMSPQAFEKIAPLHKGIVPITWRVVSPELGRPIAYHIKPGSNQWWTAIQVRYHRNPIVRLEYRNAGGSWVELQRQDYNYFVGTSMGPGPYTLRVTDAYGNTLIDSGIPLAENVETSGGDQFPPGP